ncbi:MAPEG family protein [Bowmanella denitrificans]|uniref:MAPEG family protein n=1 Tax=Bowmanella denitrificans TaxID=366582 RepID=UPI000C9B0BAA|nr:MAPEG family protein [Bowmanella denitrificans]
MVTPIYAALLTLMYSALSIRVITLRTTNKVSLGDGANIALTKAIRAHGNFIEYVPLALILLLLLEQQGSSSWLLHSLGTGLLIARLVHGLGISAIREQLKFRVTGTVLTQLILVSSAILLLVQHGS